MTTIALTLLLTTTTPTPVVEPPCAEGLIHYMPYCFTPAGLSAFLTPAVEAPPTSAPPYLTPAVGAERWRSLVARYFPWWEVDDALRVMRCESGYDPNARNKYSGASGLFQHMPRYWADRSSRAGWGGYSIFDPEANVAVAAWLWGQTGTWSHWACKP